MKALAALSAVLTLSLAGAATCADAPPPVSVSIRDTVDVWDAASGGVERGTAFLNKLQLGGTIATDRMGLDGFSAHAQLFRTDDNGLSRRVGDIQTVDSIDARPVTRLFEAWIEQKIGDEDRSVALRAGLMDLNSDYDSIQAATLFINSSQGIGADLARSGRNGPSIYPVSAAGVRLSWLPDTTWTVRLGLFDGVPGDPERPRRVVATRLSRDDGLLAIGQVDYHLGEKAKVEVGAWRYSAPLPDIVTGRPRRDEGAYASIEGPLPHLDKWGAWVRIGMANGDAQTVGGYLGAGLVGQGLIKDRPDDRLGLAVARASIGRPSRIGGGLPAAETDVELSYQVKVHNTFAVQPDVQYVVHPASAGDLPNALVVGLRFVITAGYPRKAPAAEATDPTVPPDGPQSNDDKPPVRDK